MKKGKYGNGNTRKAVLGSRYAEVQAIVNGTTRTYTVKAGDCLSVIGQKLGVDWRDIAAKNGLKDPYVIHAGDVLKY